MEHKQEGLFGAIRSIPHQNMELQVLWSNKEPDAFRQEKIILKNSFPLTAPSIMYLYIEHQIRVFFRGYTVNPSP